MLKGEIQFLCKNKGSKSEGEYPYIVLDDGKNVKIFMEGDNPFENKILREYEGKVVEAEGEFNDNGKFIANSIKIVDAPDCAEANPDNSTQQRIEAFSEDLKADEDLPKDEKDKEAEEESSGAPLSQD